MVDDPLNARQRDHSLGLMDVMMFIKRRWLLVFLCCLVVMIATGALLTSVQSRYTATAELTLIDQRQQSTPIADLLSGVPLSRQVVEQEITTMRSKAFLIEVVKRIDAESDLSILGPPIEPILPVRLLKDAKDFMISFVRPPSTLEQFTPPVANEEAPETEAETATDAAVDETLSEDVSAAELAGATQEAAFVVLEEDLEKYGDDADFLGGMLSISQRGNSFVIGISVQSGNPFHAAEIANIAAAEYTRFSLAIRGDSIEEQVQLLSGRVDELGEDLEAAETAVVDFQEQVMGVNNFTSDRLSRQIEDMSRRLVEAQADVVRADAQYQKARGNVSELGAVAAAGVLESPILGNVRAELSQLRIDRSRVSEQFGPDSTQVSAIDAVIDRIGQEIAIEAARIVSEFETQLNIATTVADSIEAELMSLEEAMLSRSRNMVELSKLRRIADANRIAYEEFLNIATESAQFQALQQPTVRLLSYAEIPTAPSYPRALVMLAISVLAGLAIGLGLSILLEAIDNKIKTVRQLRSVSGLPVIGSFTSVGQAGERKVQNKMQAGANLSSDSDEKVLAAEGHAAASFLLNMLDRKKNTIVVTSAVPNEGSSMVAYLFADTLSSRGESVLLIDATNDRIPATSKPKVVGDELVDVSDTSEIKKNASGIHTLSLSGATHTDPDILSENLKAVLMEKIQATYDYVIIDSPPMLSSSVGLRFLRDADATVVASRWNSTARQTIEACAEMLGDLGAQNTCMVLTQVNRREEQKYEYAGFNKVSKFGKSHA